MSLVKMIEANTHLGVGFSITGLWFTRKPGGSGGWVDLRVCAASKKNSEIIVHREVRL